MSTAPITSVFPEYIDNTVLKDFRACPQRFFRKRVQGLRPTIGSIGADAIFGGCFAKGAEITRKAYYVHGKRAVDSLSDGVDAALAKWASEVPVVPSRSNKTSVNLVLALQHYFNKWPLDTSELRPIEDGIEGTFTKTLSPGLLHPTTGKPLQYAAKMDMVARDNFDNFVVVDEKTTGRFSDAWLAQWDIDPQMTGYIWLLQDFQLSGAPHANIRGVEIASAISSMLVPIFRTDHQTMMWYDQTIRDVRRMIEYWHNFMYWHDPALWDKTLGNACVAYSRPCEYMRLCNSPNAEEIAAADYKVEFWNPMQPEKEPI